MPYLNRLAHLEPRDTLDERRQINLAHVGPRQARQRGISRRESAERVGSPRDDPQTAAHVLTPVLRHRILGRDTLETAGDRLDRRERVVELVPEHADEAVPGVALLLAQRDVDVAQDDESVWKAALPKRSAAYL